MWDLLPLDISLISLGVSALSFYVAMRVAWDTRFKPPKLIALLSRIGVLERAGDSELQRTRVILPAFWIRNLGAKPVIISDLRLKLACEQGQTVIARPESKFLVSKLTEKTNVIFSEKGVESFPINLDALFTGFCLVAGEIWEGNYSFRVRDEEYQQIHGQVELRIQVHLHGSRRWKTITKSTINFQNRLIEAIKPPDNGFTTQFFYPDAETK